MEHYISNEVLLLEQLIAIVEGDTQLKLSEEAVINIETCHRFLSDYCKKDPEILNRLSVGSLSLLRHYACGIGERIPNEIVKLMLFLKIQSFSYGYSGVRLALVQRLIDFYNKGVLPVVYSKDIPDERIALAHLALPLFGEGEVCIHNKIYSAQELEAKYGWQPLSLEMREADAPAQRHSAHHRLWHLQPQQIIANHSVGRLCSLGIYPSLWRESLSIFGSYANSATT